MANGIAVRQGFLYASPMPAEELEQWLVTHAQSARKYSSRCTPYLPEP